MRAAPRAILTTLLLCLVGLTACHHATEAECDEIVNKLVELELKNQGVTEPATVEARKVEARAKKRDELVSQCVGKRISASAMTCIRKATTPEQVTDECLR